MSIFAASSNFTLDVLYKGSGYDLFPQGALYLALQSESKNYKKSVSTKSKKKLLNTDICSVS